MRAAVKRGQQQGERGRPASRSSAIWASFQLHAGVSGPWTAGQHPSLQLLPQQIQKEITDLKNVFIRKHKCVCNYTTACIREHSRGQRSLKDWAKRGGWLLLENTNSRESTESLKEGTGSDKALSATLVQRQTGGNWPWAEFDFLLNNLNNQSKIKDLSLYIHTSQGLI